MHPLRKRRLMIVLFIVIGSSLVIGLMLYAMRESINLFYPPSKIVNGEAPIGRTIKAGGCVVPGSVKREDEGLGVRFEITDGAAEVPVIYEGILPDLFAEGEAAVVDGKMDKQGVFQATRVLAKHDENYTPAEVSENLQTDADAQGVEHQKSCQGINY
ncbi:cytochrome c maturation protein CcmE [Agaribacterium haliotis]|uniref:cytochrome c maturation protein CcmE n=1 Tax=Agaribacterium haliotis TaxID=2013869 RepID=UPI000BB5769B|nr:cytochrome c maturation protein CcmE [Agaribacterium haliotis]